MLETVASHALCFWHVLAGSNNDVNMLNQQSLFTDVLKGEALNVNFTLNEHEYQHIVSRTGQNARGSLGSWSPRLGSDRLF
jgi:hypothetical protein